MLKVGWWTIFRGRFDGILINFYDELKKKWHFEMTQINNRHVMGQMDVSFEKKAWMEWQNREANR